MSPTAAEAGDSTGRVEALYRQTHTALLGYLLRRTAQPEDAADLLAEVYLVAWRRRAELPPGDQGLPWLYGVARGVLANHRRSARRASDLSARLGGELLTRPAWNMPRDGADHHLREAIGAALAALTARDREVVTLSAWEGLTPAQIAVATGTTAVAVRVRLHRARARLRTELRRHGLLEDEPFPYPHHGRSEARLATTAE